MPKYIDGFVLTIKKDKKAAYKKMATEGKAAWMKFGALSYMECRADDMSPAHVVLTFPKIMKSKEDEEVWFSFITFTSKKHRNEVNKKVMEYFDKKYAGKNQDMPFDMKRFAYGGFTVEVAG